jgi:signal transduction histidine kinase
LPSVNGMTVTAPPPLRPGVLGRLGRDTQYVLLGFPIGLIAFILVLTGFVLGLGTAIIWVGLPILMATFFLARGLAVIERNRVGAVLGRKLPHAHYKTPRGPGFWSRILTPFRDGQSWLDLVHGIFRLIPSLIAFVFVVVWWVCTLGSLTYVLWGWTVPQGPGNHDVPFYLGLGDGFAIRTIFYLIAGVVFALTLYPVVRGAALLEAQFARGLLSGVNELREQVATAQAQTAAAVSAEATTLRRLERDLHDGPQASLVRVAMDLGRAEVQFRTDPEAARATVAEALAMTKDTLNELRQLSRGIAPPILVDLGLRAALNSLVERASIPVDLDVPETARLAPTIESTAYFAVAEALTNIAKHSQANECQIQLHRHEGSLFITVIDDGVGGASLAKGHGLAGLRDRVQAAGGLLTIDSPDGAGTKLTVALPV